MFGLKSSSKAEKLASEQHNTRVQSIIDDVMNVYEKHAAKVSEVLDVVINLQIHVSRDVNKLLNQKQYDPSKPKEN